MREIKFRDWNRFKQEMSKVLNIGWLDGIYMNISLDTEAGQIDYNDSPDNMECENIELMQYTGLKDKNGQEIFEGDIVYVECEDENAVVIWDEESAKFIIQFYGWYSDFDCYYGKDLEVIGNIHDNKDLLKEGE